MCRFVARGRILRTHREKGPEFVRILRENRQVVVICDFDETRRTIRVIDDPDLAKRAIREEIIGREVELGPDSAIRWI